MADNGLALNIPINAITEGFNKSMQGLKDNVNGAMGGLKSGLDTTREAMGAVGIMAFGYLDGAIKSASAAQQSTVQLQGLLKNQGIAFQDTKKDIDNFTSGITKMSTYSAGEAKNALDNLTMKGMKYSDSLKSTSALSNLAAGTNMDLTSASNLLAQAYNGKYTQLMKLGIVTKEQVKNGISYQQVLDDVNKRFSGSSQAQMNTYAGEMKILSNNMAGMKTAIGSALLPVLTNMMETINKGITPVINFIKAHSQMSAVILSSVAVIGTLIGGFSLFQKVIGILGPSVQGIVGLIGGLTLPVAGVIAGIGLLVLAYNKNFGGLQTFLNGVFKNISIIFNTFTGDMKKGMSLPQALSDAFTKAFGSQAGKNVSKFFTDLQIIWNDLQNTAKKVWPQIYAVIQDAFKGIQVIWNTILKPVLTFIIQQMGQVVQWVQANWPLISQTIQTIMNDIVTVIKVAMAILKPIWELGWNIIKNIVPPIFNLIKDTISTVIHVIEDILKLAMDLINGNWKAAWNDVCNIVKDVFGGAKKIISDILDSIGGVFKGMGQTAMSWGHDLIHSIMDGLEHAKDDIVNTVKGVAGKVVDTFKSIFGIHSPSTVMYDIGGHLVQGLINGFSKNDITSFVKGWGGSVMSSVQTSMGGNVTDWLTQAIQATGQSMSTLPALLQIAQHESGGDPNSVNNWDSNAKAGTPSKGLMQVIDPTFKEYMMVGHNNILNPIDNAIAAIRYMIGRYGSVNNVPGVKSLMAGGAYQGYADGTLNSTKGLHMYGERGIELGWSNGGDGVLNNINTTALLNTPAILQNLTGAIQALTSNQVNKQPSATTNNNNKSVNIYVDNMNVQDKGDEQTTLQQLQFMAPLT
ncbi:transglycosylase SLT domain-containing protein [Clostridium pasteurianum]|uniref:SLT domain protein n=1 Tax=Clostridium pasteurianum BC1 TaxID=86416 RepID=R4K2J7_CLOPA|nr:transglycosylase SLT domain-containing protein [Clostridium pasteurianum]AGK96808.1 SLT domain protein [Clostridium pasteurianum BC1]